MLLNFQAFSKNGLRTIVTSDPSYQSVIGSAPTLGYADIQLLNAMYQCPSKSRQVKIWFMSSRIQFSQYVYCSSINFPHPQVAMDVELFPVRTDMLVQIVCATAHLEFQVTPSLLVLVNKLTA